MQVPEAIVTIRAAMAPFRAYERIMEILEMVNGHEQKVREAKEALKVVNDQIKASAKRYDDLESDFSFFMKEFVDAKAAVEASIQAQVAKAKEQVDDANRRYADMNAKIVMEMDAFNDAMEQKRAELNGLKVQIQSAEAKLSAVNRQISQLKEKL